MAVVGGGDHDHRQLRGLRIAADLPRQLEAVHAGHFHVGDHHVGQAGLHLLHGVEPVVGVGDLVLVLRQQAARLDAHDLGVIGHQHQGLRRALDGAARQHGDAFGLGTFGGGAYLLGVYFGQAQGLGPGLGLARGLCGLLGRKSLYLALGFQRSDPLAFGSLGGFASKVGREAAGLGTLRRQPLFFGTPFRLTLRLGPGFGLACGLFRCEASSLTLGFLDGNTFTFGSFGGLALTFDLDALGLDAFGVQAFVFGTEFGLALQLGPCRRVATGLLVVAQRVGAAAEYLPADQQAQARSDQQPKEVFAHEWNVRRTRCGEHRCESAVTPRRQWRHAHKFLELLACFMHRAASPCGGAATHIAMLRHGSAFHFDTSVALAGHGPSAMQMIDTQATRDALPFARLVPALHRAFAEGCEVPPRQAHAIGQADGSVCTSLIMPAWSRPRSARPHYGVKIVNIAPGNAARGLPGLHASYLLFDALTGVPLSCIDGSVLTTRRTAAASALAASFLARSDARRLLVVGTGAVARVLPEAYRAVRPIEHVAVWARAPDKAAALADALRADGFDAAAEGDLAAAVAQSDIVSCATLATEPLVQGRWLAPGSHLDLIGSFTPQMREADDDCFAGASLFVDTDEALRKSGDLLGPLSRGVLDAARRYGTLADLCSGSLPGRQGPLERTVFKSVGTALEDLAAAVLVLDTGQRR